MIINHEEAKIYAEIHYKDSNLARCYLEVLQTLEKEAQKILEEKPTITQQPQDEICSKAICLYCEHDGGNPPCEDCGVNYGNFKGRKLSPVR